MTRILVAAVHEDRPLSTQLGGEGKGEGERTVNTISRRLILLLERAEVESPRQAR